MAAVIIDQRAVTSDRLDMLIEAVWLCIIFSIPVYFNPFGYASFYIARSLLLQLLTCLLLGLVLAQWFLHARPFKMADVWNGIRQHPILTAVLIYGLLLVISTACSIMPERSFWGNMAYDTGVVAMLSWIAFFVVIALKVRSRAQVYRALSALLMSAALVSLFGIVQFWLRWDLLNGRVHAANGNPLQLSAFLSMVIPVNLAMLIVTWDEYKKGKNSLFKFVAILGAFILSMICLALAQYSITLLLYVVGIFCFFGLIGLYLQQKTTLVMALLSLLLLAVIAIALMGNLFMTTAAAPAREEAGGTTAISEQVGLPTLSTRLLIWDSTVKIILEQPEVPFHHDDIHVLRRIIGYGPGTLGVLTQSNYPALLRSEYTYLSTLLGQPENHYLYLAATTGLLGLAAFLIVLGILFYTGLQVLHRARDKALILLAAACLAAVFQYCVHLLFNPSTIVPEGVFWLALGLIPTLACIEDNERKQVVRQAAGVSVGEQSHGRYSGGLGRKALAGSILLIFLGIGVMLTANPFLADLKLRQAVNKFNSNDRQVALEMYVEATNMQPRQPVYHGFLASAAYMMAQQADNADEKAHLLRLSEIAYGEGSRLESGFAFWNYLLGDLYTYWMLNGDEGKWADALHVYETADGLFPHNAVILNKWATALMLGGDYAEADRKLEEARKSDPVWAQNRYYAGLLSVIEGKPCAVADMMCSDCRENQPQIKDFLYFMDFCQTIDMYGKIGMVSSAFRSCQDQIRGDWIKLSMMGIVETSCANPIGALEAFRQSAEIVPSENATVLAGIIRGTFPEGSAGRNEAEQVVGELIKKAGREK